MGKTAAIWGAVGAVLALRGSLTGEEWFLYLANWAFFAGIAWLCYWLDAAAASYGRRALFVAVAVVGVFAVPNVVGGGVGLLEVRDFVGLALAACVVFAVAYAAIIAASWAGVWRIAPPDESESEPDVKRINEAQP